MVTQVCPVETDRKYSPVAIHNVAVATDFTECSERALQHGLAVANHFGATLHLLHLLRPSQLALSPGAIPPLQDAYDRDCEELTIGLQRNHQLDNIDCRRWVERGEVSEIVGNFVHKQQIDLMVVGTHGRTGLQRLLRGSVAHEIFHCVHCPVLTVGPLSPGTDSQLQLKRMVFSTDLSRESLASIPYLLTILQEWHAELDVVHVCSAARFGHSELLDEYRSKIEAPLIGKSDATVRCHLIIGEPAPAVLDLANRKKSDLIVLGLKPHSALYSSPFWSQAHEIVRHARCPVLSVRALNPGPS
jgi:nucleotide-binding universal stress UspA family protein